MYENHVAFIEWARRYETGGMDTRSVMSENAWLCDARCKVIRLEEARPLDEEVALVLKSAEEITGLVHDGQPQGRGSW